MDPHRAFVSYAREDVERFVKQFATGVRARGVDAWVAFWEMLPGDSLPRKIFNEGLDPADTAIIVLSRFSVTKRWVLEELDAAVVKRIETGCRLIPIVLDGLTPSDLPPPIRHLLFVNVPDPTHPEEAVDFVVRAVYGSTNAPPVGSPPAYAGLAAARIGRLDRIDSLVLKVVGDDAVKHWRTSCGSKEIVAQSVPSLGVSEQAILESLDVLDGERLIKLTHVWSGGATLEFTDHGIETYARNYVERYDAFCAQIVARLAGWPTDVGTVGDLMDLVDAPGLLVEHMLRRLALRRYLKLLPPTGGGPRARTFHTVSARLRRAAG